MAPSLPLDPSSDPDRVRREIRLLTNSLEKRDRRLAEMVLSRCDFLEKLAVGDPALALAVSQLRDEARQVLSEASGDE